MSSLFAFAGGYLAAVAVFGLLQRLVGEAASLAPSLEQGAVLVAALAAGLAAGLALPGRAVFVASLLGALLATIAWFSTVVATIQPMYAETRGLSPLLVDGGVRATLSLAGCVAGGWLARRWTWRTDPRPARAAP